VAETFALPRSSLKLLRLILVGYLHEGGNDRKPSGPGDVGAAIGIDSTLVSRNNAALAALGLLEAAESRRWRLTDGGVDVARAFEYEADEEAGEALSEVLGSNAFVRRVLAFVRSRGGVEEDQVISHMARTAGVKRTSEFLTGARALLELLQVAGLVEADGDTVRVSTPRREAEPKAEPKPTRPPVKAYGGADVYEQVLPETAGALVTLHINLSSSDLSTDDAADELAARIKRLLDALG
jgi:hypothetical protein